LLGKRKIAPEIADQFVGSERSDAKEAELSEDKKQKMGKGDSSSGTTFE